MLPPLPVGLDSLDGSDLERGNFELVENRQWQSQDEATQNDGTGRKYRVSRRSLGVYGGAGLKVKLLRIDPSSLTRTKRHQALEQF